jgi:hypothetical protein
MARKQANMGRPPLAPEQKRDASITFRVTKAERAELEAAAKLEGKTVTRLLSEALRRQKNGRSWARCAIRGCKRKATRRGLCGKCYNRLRMREVRAAAHVTLETCKQKKSKKRYNKD